MSEEWECVEEAVELGERTVIDAGESDGVLKWVKGVSADSAREEVHWGDGEGVEEK